MCDDKTSDENNEEIGNDGDDVEWTGQDYDQGQDSDNGGWVEEDDADNDDEAVEED